VSVRMLAPRSDVRALAVPIDLNGTTLAARTLRVWLDSKTFPTDFMGYLT